MTVSSPDRAMNRPRSHGGPPVITAWSTVSALGRSVEEFAAAVVAGRSGVSTVDQEQWGRLPSPRAAVVDAFSASAALGRKGTRSMDRVTALAVSTVGSLLSESDAGTAAAGAARSSAEDIGLVLGTSMGSAASTMAFTRESLTGTKPFHVDPAQFPNTVMNCAAGQSAIWHGLRGPNATIAAGSATGLHALAYATRLQDTGHAQRILCGSAEEFTAARAWLDFHRRGGEPQRWAPGEACSVLLLDTPYRSSMAGETVLAELSALAFGVVTRAAVAAEVLARCVRRACALAGIGASADVLWLPGTHPAERPAVHSVIGAPAQTMRVADLVGDTGAASSIVQVTAAMALSAAGEAPRHALVTALDTDGTAACCVLTLVGRP